MMIILFLLMGLSILAALVFSILCKQFLSNVILLFNHSLHYILQRSRICEIKFIIKFRYF